MDQKTGFGVLNVISEVSQTDYLKVHRNTSISMVSSILGQPEDIYSAQHIFLKVCESVSTRCSEMGAAGITNSVCCMSYLSLCYRGLFLRGKVMNINLTGRG